MSWLSGLKSKPVQTQAEIREERRRKLEAERLQRAQNRNRIQKQLLDAQKAREEADLVFQEFLDIATDLFDDDTPIETSSEKSASFSITSSTSKTKRLISFFGCSKLLEKIARWIK